MLNWLLRKTPGHFEEPSEVATDDDLKNRIAHFRARPVTNSHADLPTGS